MTLADESLNKLRNISAFLMEHEQRHFYSIEQSSIGVWELDVINGKLYWDATMFRIYDKSKQLFNGEYFDWAQSVHKDDLHKSEQDLKDCAEGRNPNFEAIFRVSNNGRWRIVIAQAVPKKDEIGKIISIVGTNYMLPIGLESKVIL